MLLWATSGTLLVPAQKPAAPKNLTGVLTAFVGGVGITEYSLPFRKMRSEYSVYSIIDRNYTIIYGTSGQKT